MPAMKLVQFYGISKHTARAVEIATNQGLSLSAWLRQLVAKEIYKVAAEERRVEAASRS